MFIKVLYTLGHWQSLHEPLLGSFILNTTQCSLHFDKPQKNEIHSLSHDMSIVHLMNHMNHIGLSALFNKYNRIMCSLSIDSLNEVNRIIFRLSIDSLNEVNRIIFRLSIVSLNEV